MIALSEGWTPLLLVERGVLALERGGSDDAVDDDEDDDELAESVLEGEEVGELLTMTLSGSILRRLTRACRSCVWLTFKIIFPYNEEASLRIRYHVTFARQGMARTST